MRYVLAAVLASSTIMASPLSSMAAPGVDPYSPGSSGFDVSYPQCGSSLPNGQFGIVGVNHGRPFDQNPCLSSEYAHWTSHALYINTGYDPIYTDSNHTTPACTSSSARVAGTAAQKAAWAAGCSEASKSSAYAASVGATGPSAWWLDVEVANSWSSSRLSLNRYTIRGIVDTLHQLSTAPVGIYSNSYMWSRIAGSFHPNGVSADWYATGTGSASSAKAYCGTGFSGHPVWLAQFVTQFDGNYAC
jgi:hypothetical protein